MRVAPKIMSVAVCPGACPPCPPCKVYRRDCFPCLHLPPVPRCKQLVPPEHHDAEQIRYAKAMAVARPERPAPTCHRAGIPCRMCRCDWCGYCC